MNPNSSPVYLFRGCLVLLRNHSGFHVFRCLGRSPPPLGGAWASGWSRKNPVPLGPSGRSVPSESRAAAPPSRRWPANQRPPSRSRASIVPALSSGITGYLKACAPGWRCLFFGRGSAELSGHGQPPRALHRRQDAHRGAGHLEGKCPGVGVGASHGSSQARRGLGGRDLQ